jgi:hypothetical protein
MSASTIEVTLRGGTTYKTIHRDPLTAESIAEAVRNACAAEKAPIRAVANIRINP